MISKLMMYCPETSQVLLVLVMAIDIIIVGTLVPAIMILSEQTMRNTAVVILSLTLLIAVTKILKQKKIGKYLGLTFHTARILTTIILFWATTTTFMDLFAKALIVFSTISLLFDGIKYLHQPSKK